MSMALAASRNRRVTCKSARSGRDPRLCRMRYKRGYAASRFMPNGTVVRLWITPFGCGIKRSVGDVACHPLRDGTYT